MKIITQITNAIKGSIGPFSSHDRSYVYLHEPNINKSDWKFVRECLERNFVSSVGNYVTEFETRLKKYTKSKFVAAVINGTSAIHLALSSLGANEKDEILLPSLNFVAAANAIKYCNSTPHFVDVEEQTLGIDPEKLDRYLKKILIRKKNYFINKLTKKRIRFIIVLHVFGHPCEIIKIKKVVKKYNIKVIEDAAEALGSKYYDKHLGTFGDIGVLSFNGNKIITTGGGGAILTDSKILADKIKQMSTTSKIPHKWKFEYSDLGYNYRMPGINASLGCAQMLKLPSYVKEKRKLYKKYESTFKHIKEIRILKEPKNAKSNYWLQTIILDKKVSKHRDQILNNLNKTGYLLRPVWKPLHKLNHLKNCPKMKLSTTENLEMRIINLPSSAYLSSHKF